MQSLQHKGNSLGILMCSDAHSKYYVDACKDLDVPYMEIDFESNEWLASVQKSDCNAFLVRPPSQYQEANSVYMERLYILNQVLGFPIYPCFHELMLYENKRVMYGWLNAHNFPHVPTNVFLRKNEVIAFLEGTRYPVVFKSNIASNAKGVTIVRSKRQALRIVNQIFGRRKKIRARGYAKKYLWKGVVPYTPTAKRERNFAIIQGFEKIKWEWRFIKVGESYFVHQKMLKGDFASGSHLKGWDTPPDALVKLCTRIVDIGKFNSMAIDVFETFDGRFLVNELQSLFGARDNFQMLRNGKAGRLVRNDKGFDWEEGDFCRNHCYNLRVEDCIRILGTGSVQNVD